MKPVWKLILVATLVLSAANCVLLLRNTSPSLTTATSPLRGEYVVDVSYRVPYDYARVCIDNYAKRISADGDSSMVQSFTIDRQDFLQTIEIQSESPINSKYDYARGYIGIDVVTNEFHIFFTPVEGVKTDKNGNIVDAGRDVILYGKYENKDRFSGRLIAPANGNDEGAYMLDLNAPCPETCGSLPPPGVELNMKLKELQNKKK